MSWYVYQNVGKFMGLLVKFFVSFFVMLQNDYTDHIFLFWFQSNYH